MNRATSQQSKRAWRVASILALAVVGSLHWAAAAQDAAPMTKVTYLPHWIPQAQFAGYYMAAEKGFYRQHGLDVTILDGGPRKPVRKALVTGEATFGSHFLSSALKMRDDGVPLVHLAQITQRSALMIVAHKSHGVHSVKDLDGKKMTLWEDFTTQPEALFRKYNLRVKTITQGPTINLFMRGGVDASSAMLYNEYHLFLNSGLDEDEVTVITYDKHDLDFPEDSVLCLAETWRTKPDVCRAFVRATLEGWQYVLSHREESLRVVMQRTEQARTGTNRSHQRWMLERMCELIQPVPPATEMGVLSREAYDRVVRELKKGGQIKSAPAFEEFHVPLHP
ncbi:MAG: ABC transporter substrate-binding protein [Verrucomicrobia bacterium]|nr:ABC transporter substrate-binding protein [Verrucomicrobiota bacterium]